MRTSAHASPLYSIDRVLEVNIRFGKLTITSFGISTVQVHNLFEIREQEHPHDIDLPISYNLKNQNVISILILCRNECYENLTATQFLYVDRRLHYLLYHTEDKFSRPFRSNI